MNKDIKFDWLMTILGFWFIGGVYIDGWAHNHLDSALETFFTPWHAMLYSGFLVCAIALILQRKNMSAGYKLSLVGMGIFAIGGLSDMIWHIVFGIEKDIEALLSPTHLLLVIGAALILSGPARASWNRWKEAPKNILEWLPTCLSITFTISVISFITQFAHPVRLTAFGIRPQEILIDWMQARGISGFLIQTSLLAGFCLYATKKWNGKMPFGFFTIIFGLNTFGMSLMTYAWAVVWSAIISGILLDICVKKISFRFFSFLIPALYMLGYFIANMSISPIWWSVHLWTGSIVITGCAGVLLSYLLEPTS